MKRKFLLLFLLIGLLQAREYKSVFDCSSDDPRYISGRMMLIEKTMELIEKRGDKATFAITVHGSCIPMVSRAFDEIV